MSFSIKFAINRPVGYGRDGLVAIPVRTDDIHKHFAGFSNHLKSSGMISGLAEASVISTEINEDDNGFEWKGKEPSLVGDFKGFYGSVDMGKTLGWQIRQGRGFSTNFPHDTTSIILNETAVKFMGLKHPMGETIKWDKRFLTVNRGS